LHEDAHRDDTAAGHSTHIIALNTDLSTGTWASHAASQCCCSGGRCCCGRCGKTHISEGSCTPQDIELVLDRKQNMKTAALQSDGCYADKDDRHRQLGMHACGWQRSLPQASRSERHCVNAMRMRVRSYRRGSPVVWASTSALLAHCIQEGKLPPPTEKCHMTLLGTISSLVASHSGRQHGIGLSSFARSNSVVSSASWSRHNDWQMGCLLGVKGTENGYLLIG
jgi:hypothetical protein